ncbi:MAG: outer membrane protein transport protein, partial [Deltaproteobacteria bacterium]|nr:outer membrane protein transport protein [Deltaproteobacteria bacterium]
MIYLSKGLRAALFAAALGFSLNLYALNGAQLIGFSATTASMGGAGAAAAPQEGSVMITNPAGLTEISRGVSFNFLLGFPRSQANTTAATLGNTVGNQVSNDDPVILPSGNVVLPFLDDRLHVGVGAFQIAGFGNDYARSPAAPGTTGNNYSTHSLYGLLKIVTAAAYEYNEKLSIGLGIHVNQQQLESNSAVLPTLTQTTGIDRSDRSFGAGVGVGILYKLSDLIHLGASYTSEQFMNEFSRYQDLFPRGLNYPQQANIGAAFYPIEGLLAAA